MKKIGLALSGGGFRASLYHLGLVRFLRDAGLLSQVTHITSVSGGSIIAAHLLLNWDRYNGSGKEFEAAASEFLSFVRLDIRNRIARCFSLTLPLRGLRLYLGKSNRKLTLTGLLEYHYEKYLYRDTSLFELPEKPQLHLLATNLSEGCLCSFTRDGLLMMRRQPGNTLRIDRIHVGLATVAMAVTASSAFPGFFPPLVLTGAEVGASVGEFGRQAYTDGGVFDNLGVRMFGCLEQASLADPDNSLDGVLVSDVGKRIEVQGHQRRRRTDSDRSACHRYSHGPGLATGVRKVPWNAPIRFRSNHGSGRVGRGSDGHAPGNPAPASQYPHRPRSFFAAGNQQPGATRLLCGPSSLPETPPVVW